jgi:hypothetical protein
LQIISCKSPSCSQVSENQDELTAVGVRSTSNPAAFLALRNQIVVGMIKMRDEIAANQRKIAANSIFLTTLRDKLFRIRGSLQMIRGLPAQNKPLNPKTG